MSRIRVQTASADSPVIIEPGLLGSFAREIRQEPRAGHSIFVVSSPEIWSLWGERFSASFLTAGESLNTLFVPAGERHKRLSTIERLAGEMSRKGAKRDSLLIAFGGGVIGDITGFLASIYMRGIQCVQAPTTYLAQIDSSIGGKTGVNLRVGKNLIGTFHQPLAVLCDPAVLSTLAATELRAGIVESIKAAVLGDREFFLWLEIHLDRVLAREEPALTEAIERSVRIKADIVNADERESGPRMLLNLGHTVGHAIEAATGYRSLLHGEAVAWGMIAAIQIARTRGLPETEADRMERLLFRAGPFRRFQAREKGLLLRTQADKKHLHGVSRFVLPETIGRAAVVEDVKEPELRDAISAMMRVMKERGA